MDNEERERESLLAQNYIIKIKIDLNYVDLEITR